MTAKDSMIEMQNHIVALSSTVGRIEGKIDTFINQMKTQDDRSTDQETRLRKVESRQHWYSAFGGGIGLLIGRFVPGVFNHS